VAEPRLLPVVVDASALVDADVSTVERLALLGLAARRAGGVLRLTGVPPRLRDLLVLAGLDEVLGCPGSGLQVGRQAEQAEELGAAEEVRDPGDLPG
jgi:anti-anti-sigma regulatory factor